MGWKRSREAVEDLMARLAEGDPQASRDLHEAASWLLEDWLDASRLIDALRSLPESERELLMERLS